MNLRTVLGKVNRSEIVQMKQFIICRKNGACKYRRKYYVDIILANFNWNKCHTQDERNIIFNLSQDKSLVNPMYK